MEHKNIYIGQKLLLRGRLHGAYDAEVVQVDPHAISDSVQVKVVLYPGDEPSFLWVNPERLMVFDR